MLVVLKVSACTCLLTFFESTIIMTMIEIKYSGTALL